MSNDRFNYTISKEKSNFPHMRNTNRFINHPYQHQSQHIESTMQNELKHLAHTYITPPPPSLILDKNTPESPVSTEMSNEDAKPNDAIKLPENLENLPKAEEFPVKRSRWNTNEEILALLLNFSKHEEWQSKDVVIRPESGCMLMYSRKKVRYRRDGYCWKKRKDGKTTREDHMKLKVQGVECIYGCYVHSAVLPTFHRRCYWLLQNPDIVLVHYLNVPYPDDSKLAALIPNIAFWTEKKEWTREELLLQLKPMYENPGLEGGKENETEEAKLNRVNVSSFIESMIAQLLEKQRYVRAALANSLECGCGNRKCLDAARCTRPIRRISSAKKQGKRPNMHAKLQEKRATATNERNVIKTSSVRKLTNAESRIHNSQSSANTSYYNNQMQMNTNSEQSSQPTNHGTQQIQQLVQTSPQSEICPTNQPTHELQPKMHQQLIQSANKEMLTNYARPETYLNGNVDFVNADNRHYQTNYACPLNEQYVPNNEIEITNEEKQQERLNIGENVSSLLPYNHDENEYSTDKYQSDTTDGSDCNTYSTIHHQASPNDSFTSVEDADNYTNGDLLDDLIMNVGDPCYNYENNSDYMNADRSLYELIIQLTQKEKKATCSNSLVTCEKLEQYTIQNENVQNYTSMFENSLPPVSDANGNFLNSCSRYSTATASENVNHVHNVHSASEFTRIENNNMANYSNEIDVNFINATNDFNLNERCTSNHSMHDTNQTNNSCVIIDLSPEWSYCEGGTKLLIIGPWYFQSEYSVLFDSYSVPATLVQAGVLKCYCPEHTVGLVSIQVVSAGSIISNSVIFEYKKRPNYEENPCHNLCNIKAEQYNQYMYENDTLLKFILIHRIEAIQDETYTHSSSLVNKYERIREETST